MKSDIRLLVRKTRSHLSQLLGVTLLLAVGTCFFITLFTISQRYEETAEQYFKKQSYADETFYGVFTQESVDRLTGMEGVLSVQGRTVTDYRDDERVFRAVSLTEGINVPSLYEGRLPEDKTECLLLKRNADAMKLSIGDTLLLGDQEVIITGLAASPEYIYMVQNERTIMASPDSFGVVYVTTDFYPPGYNQILLRSEGKISADQYAETIQASQVVGRKDQPNYVLYRSDLEEIRTFAYIFPLIFAVLIAIVIYVMLSRTVHKDRRQIGTLKALGVSDSRIISIYLSQFCLAALTGTLIGGGAALLISGSIVDIFSEMFEVPGLGFVFYPVLWAGAGLVSVLLCGFSALTALVSVNRLLPAHAMRPRTPKGGRRILLERIAFLWKRMSFNTRYALKNSLRNKNRFFAVVLGMCGSCALLTFSLGFYDSIGNTQDKYFNDFANYDVIITFPPMPLTEENPDLGQIDRTQKVFLLPVDIKGDSYTLAVAEKGFDMVKIPTGSLSEGIIIPEYYAQQWDAKVGDTLLLNETESVVSAVVPQHLGLMFYTGFDYMEGLTNEVPAAYNAAYGKDSNLAELTTYLDENEIEYSTRNDDKTSFNSILETMSVLIWFMIACSVVLGFTVLYSVGLINLSVREYEYMFMGVMGYPHKSIMTAHIKETVLQLILAIPLGFGLGWVLLESIKGEFSGDNFVIASTIHPLSYLISALAVICITILMAFVTSHHISRLDIVEGLKEQSE